MKKATSCRDADVQPALETIFSVLFSGKPCPKKLSTSAAVGNSSQANSALPLLLLPQIIFSGVLFKLQGVGATISYLMLSRWAIGAYGTIVNVNSLVPAAFKTDSLKDLPFPTGIAYEQTWTNLSFNWLILLVHIIVYLSITASLQKRKDIL